MSAVIEVSHISKRYGEHLALDDVNLSIDQDAIYGLLGRNGAGKTTLMSILTAQNFQTAGLVRIYGEEPYENARVLRRTCFVRENQKYPEGARVFQALRMARLFFPQWNGPLADRLVDDFQLPLKKRVKSLSRGQLSAVGIVIGMAARADITFFDEPHLGLDAVARQLFYDRLLEDYAACPRTLVLSSHLIDEVAGLLEHVVVLERGRVVMDEAVDDLRGSAYTVAGESAAVARSVDGRNVIHREQLGGVSSATVLRRISPAERASMASAGLEVAPVSLQQLIVRISMSHDAARNGALADPGTMGVPVPHAGAYGRSAR